MTTYWEDKYREWNPKLIAKQDEVNQHLRSLAGYYIGSEWWSSKCSQNWPPHWDDWTEEHYMEAVTYCQRVMDNPLLAEFADVLFPKETVTQ